MNPKAAPFFNYRKRHRQAIVSDPSQLSTDPTKSEPTQGNSYGISSNNAGPTSFSRNSVTQSGLMDVKGSFNQKQNILPARPSTQSSMTKPKLPTGWNNIGSSFNVESQQIKGNKAVVSKGIKNNSKPQSTECKEKPALFSHNQDFRTSSNDSFDMWSKNRPQNGARGRSATYSSSATVYGNQNSFNTKSTNSNTISKKNMPSGNLNVQRYEQQSFAQPNSSDKQISFIRNSSGPSTKVVDQSSTLPSSSVFCDKFPKESQKAKPNLKDNERSMRVFTSTIRNIQDWISHGPPPCLVIFEIYGIIILIGLKLVFCFFFSMIMVQF